MKPDDITDKKSLNAWLKGQSDEDAIAIGQRVALRIAPLWTSAMNADWARNRGLITQPIFRQLLTAGVDRVYANTEFRNVTDFRDICTLASLGAYSAANVALDAAVVAANEAPNPAAAATDFVYVTARAAGAAAAAAASANGNVVSATADAAEVSELAGYYPVTSYLLSESENLSDGYLDAFWHQVRTDAANLATNGNPFDQPLWHGSQPEEFVKLDAASRAIWRFEQQGLWSFWTRWWDGVLSGKQINWDLQRDVALIPDADWQQGPAHIAELISIKELDYLVEATPNSEDIARGPDGLFFSVPRTTIRPDLFRDAKERVSDTLVEIRAVVTSNSARYLESHLARLDAVLQRYPDRPQRVHDEFEQTRHAIEVMVRAEGLPQFELQDRLLRQLDDGAIDIRRSDKEVARTVKARASSRLHRMKAERKAKFDGAMHEAADESRLDLKQEILEDLAATNDPLVPEEQKDEPAYRLVSRGARMAKTAKDESVKAADDLGKIVKGAEAAGKIIEHAPGWWDIISTALFGWVP